MREILFRGKRLNNGEWVEGFYNHLPCVRFGADEHMIQTVLENGKIGMLYDIDPSTVGQYTGLLEKHDKRIFEGDVIKRFWLGSEILYCVQYDGENAHFIGKALNKIGFTTFDGDGEMFEVIGNITDNPELLGK